MQRYVCHFLSLKNNNYFDEKKTNLPHTPQDTAKAKRARRYRSRKDILRTECMPRSRSWAVSESSSTSGTGC